MRLSQSTLVVPSMPRCRRSTAASVQQPPDDAVQSVSTADVSGETISMWIGLVSATDFVRVTYIYIGLTVAGQGFLSGCWRLFGVL